MRKRDNVGTSYSIMLGILMPQVWLRTLKKTRPPVVTKVKAADHNIRVANTFFFTKRIFLGYHLACALPFFKVRNMKKLR